MDINEYQNQARKSNQISADADNSTLDQTIVVPLLGIAGEIGSLQAAYKKRFVMGTVIVGLKLMSQKNSVISCGMCQIWLISFI